MGVLDQFRLDGRVAVVTGAASGIGLALAEAFAEAGADVACADIDAKGAQKAADRIASLGRRAIAITVDVSQEEQVRRMVDQTVQQLGDLHIAVANAGIGALGKSLPEVSLADWDRVIAVNLTGVFLTLREAARVMVPKRRGKLISIASIYGLVGDFMGSAHAYTAAKGAVVNLTRTVAVDLAPHNIQVNAIAPGFFRTQIGGGILSQENPDEQTRAFLQRIEERTPIGRIGDVAELKGLGVFLASDASSYCTGYTYAADGGWLAW